VVVTDH